MYKYQNISKTTQVVMASGKISSGEVKAGEEVLVEFPLENPNFKYVGQVEDAVNQQTASENKTQTEENE